MWPAACLVRPHAPAKESGHPGADGSSIEHLFAIEQLRALHLWILVLQFPR
jgi:hypothetical protein